MAKRALWTAGRNVCDGEKRDKSLLYAVVDAARQVGPAAAEQGLASAECGRTLRGVQVPCTHDHWQPCALQFNAGRWSRRSAAGWCSGTLDKVQHFD